MIRNWYNHIAYPALKIKREITKLITQAAMYRVIGYFWMSIAYFAVATDSQFDPVFKARD